MMQRVSIMISGSNSMAADQEIRRRFDHNELTARQMRSLIKYATSAPPSSLTLDVLSIAAQWMHDHDDIDEADYADDTRLIPVQLDTSGPHVIARTLPSGFADLAHWANADGVAVLAPDGGTRGHSVPVIAL